MSTIAEIIKAAERLGAEEFVTLRTALDRVEERLWDRELRRVTAKHREEKLTDAKIDELVLKRRSRSRQPFSTNWRLSSVRN
jgi:hypothetical protein